MTTQETQLNSAMTIRRLDLDGPRPRARWRSSPSSTPARLSTGAVLGIEVEGRLLAAIEIETGKVIADPFSRTSELRALLKLRASQLDDRPGRLPKRELAPVRAGARPSGRRRLAGRPDHQPPPALAGPGQCCSRGAIVRPASDSCSQ